MAYTAMRRVLASRQVYIHTPCELDAWWKGHHIHVERKHSVNGGNWYIQVSGPDGLYIYNGWWRDSANKTVEQAVEEAFAGAHLVEPTS